MMKPKEPLSQNDGIPKWARKLTLAQITLLATASSVLTLFTLLTQTTEGDPTTFELATVLVSAVITLWLWIIWYRIRKARSSWYTDN
jgi:hypothetical protein